MSDPNQIHVELERCRARAAREADEFKDSALVHQRLSAHYRALTASERVVADLALADWVLSPDESVRFDAMALIREFEVRSAVPSLQSLADRLKGETGPGAPFELKKASTLMADLTDAPQAGEAEAGGPVIQELTVEAMYGLVLVLDPENGAARVPVTGDECSSTSSCVAVPVRPYVDGAVSLWLGPSGSMPDGIKIFSGTVDTPEGGLAITVPEESTSIAMDVGEPTVKVTIAVDDLANAAKVWVGADL